ncbi:MAG: VWA domain-containing protein [Candidatus Omnitrophota bacterium]
MTIHNPFILFLIPAAIAVVLYARKKAAFSGFRFSSGELLAGLKSTFKLRLSRKLIFLRLAALVLIIIALARPQAPVANSKIQAEGVDIVLAVDCSTSMLAEDFSVGGKRQNRLEAVKSVVRDFIKARASDRIAIVAFAARAYTVCPLTLDHGWLLENLQRVKTGLVEDGTAVGSGVASAINRLRGSKAKSKIVILLTDGRNNTGKISPLTAAEAAAALKIKIYTIGAGTKGLAPYPAQDFFGNIVYQQVQIDLDEESLTKIADITKAKYYRATDTESLKAVYKEIDRLEKTPMDELGYLEYNELFVYFLISALALVLIEIILANIFLRRLP